MNAHDVPMNLLPETEASTAPKLEYIPPCELPTPWAKFALHGFIDQADGKEHLAITLGDITGEAPVLARIHSECLTGDALFSQRCDCGAQLQAAMQRIATEGRGVILYLRQEGRGIGLVNKLRAYRLQDSGMDTVQANHALGFGDDERDYRLVKPILTQLGVTSLRLMTNNPRKLRAMQDAGVPVAERVPHEAGRNAANEQYLATKAAKLEHMFAQDKKS